MYNTKNFNNLLPVLIIGLIDGCIVVLSLFCFLQARGYILTQIFLYTTLAMIFLALLLFAGAYLTRKEELNSSAQESKTLKIYKALDIDEKLKDAMVADTVAEKKNWERSWQNDNNTTNTLSPLTYAISMLLGFVTGGIIILLNNYMMNLPDYKALLLPFVLLGFLGFIKYKLSNKNPVTGMLLISISGIAAAMGAYYAGALF